MKRCGAGYVFQHGIAPCPEQTSHRGSAPRSHGAMQSRRTVLVLRMDIGAFVEEATNGLRLPLGIPRGTVDETVRCVVQRGASAMICRRVWVGAGRQQESNDLDPITGRGQMQRSISHIDPMKDR